MLPLLLIAITLVAATMAAAVACSRSLTERKREAYCLGMALRQARQALSDLSERRSATATSRQTLERIKAEKGAARDELCAELTAFRSGEQDRRQVTVKRAMKWQRARHGNAA